MPGLVDAVAQMADALQVLVLSVESCLRDLDPEARPGTFFAVNKRLLAIADEMRFMLQALARLE